jgi:hypothetical protein
VDEGNDPLDPSLVECLESSLDDLEVLLRHSPQPRPATQEEV